MKDLKSEKLLPVIDEAKERRQVLREYRALLSIANIQKEQDRILIRKAFDITLEAHKGVRRKSGEAYIFHPLAVARIVAEDIGLGTTSIVCALMHDVVEDTDLNISDIRDLFGEKVAHIVDGLTKIEGLFDQTDSQQAENFRKIILTLADDIRVILIKLADRLHNMRTLDSMRKDKQLKIASETLYIYAPLAHRLGLYNMKSELEDLALKYKAPLIYQDIDAKLRKTQAVRTRFVNRFSIPIKREMDKSGLSYEIKGRTKSIYSIYSKMRSKNIPFEEVYDVFAIRIIVESTPETEKSDCWKVYSLITDHYQPNPDRLRDWISTPKANGYESLHTTVMSPTGKWVEVQIRTRRMDQVAEKGYAAHWRYKERNNESALDEWIARVRELLEDPEMNAIDFVDDFKLNLFAKEIFVFTPKGDIHALPHRATALDFAYDIHTDLGNRCVGAKVNQKLVPLSSPLSSGDQVEIIKSRVQHPREEWLDFVVTAKAKSAVKAFLRDERKNEADKGEQILRDVFTERNISFTEDNIRVLNSIYKVTATHELFYKIGSGQITRESLEKLRGVNNKISYKLPKVGHRKTLEEIVEATRGKRDSLVIGNQQKLKYKLATCCNPIPGDDVVGFVTRDGTIFIHRVSCPNTERIMANYGYRVVKAKWDTRQKLSFLAGIKVTGFDRSGLVNEVTQIISSDMNVNMRSITFDSNDGTFEGTIMVYVQDTQHLRSLREQITAIEGVIQVTRVE